jgi:radical SAM superfamily enzyme YgiQ (UPF0313 family)
LIGRLNRRFGNAGISFSLPSLRIESFTLETPELLAEIRKSGLTFAVEAGTDGLRRRLNKPIDEERFFSVLQKAVESGWSQVKLYLMFGFPDAGDEREAICAFVDRLLARFPRLALKLNVGMLVPKPHTPLQWAAQMPVAEAHRVLAFLRERYRRGRVRLSWHQPEMGLLEGMLARGDGRPACCTRPIDWERVLTPGMSISISGSGSRRWQQSESVRRRRLRRSAEPLTHRCHGTG